MTKLIRSVRIEASFIKSRNSKTTALLLTFNLQERPYNIYIPGKPSDTAMYKYQDRIMICHNCHKQADTNARCRRKGVCRNFGEDYHNSEKTNKFINESESANC